MRTLLDRPDEFTLVLVLTSRLISIQPIAEVRSTYYAGIAHQTP
jgi:hypothetical protein